MTPTHMSYRSTSFLISLSIFESTRLTITLFSPIVIITVTHDTVIIKITTLTFLLLVKSMMLG